MALGGTASTYDSARTDASTQAPLARTAGNVATGIATVACPDTPRTKKPASLDAGFFRHGVRTKAQPM